MIRSWNNKASLHIWEQHQSKAFPGLDVAAAVDLLLALNIARHPRDLLTLRSAGLRKKKGGAKKRWTMTVDRRWCIRFDVRNGDAHDVKIVGVKPDKSKG